MPVALAVLRIGEGEVCIGKEAIDIFRCVGHFSRSSQELLLPRGEYVLLPAANVPQVPAVALQLGLGSVKAVQGLVGNGENLWCLKADSGRKGHSGAHVLTLHGLILGIPGVLICFPHTVIGQILRQDPHSLRLLQVSQELGRAVRQVTGVSGQLLGHDFQLLQVGAPGLVRGVEILNGPLVGLSNLTALEYFFRF